MSPRLTLDPEAKLYGLIGRNIAYSFSRSYFSEKFSSLGLTDSKYVNFDLQSLEEFKSAIKPHLNRIAGLNVTIPYKEEIISLLDEIDPVAERIGAVNTIKVLPNGKLKGFNTDVYGFEKSLSKALSSDHKSALILGTGGASKAVAHVLNKMGLNYFFVSRTQGSDVVLSYSGLDEEVVRTNKLIINCTPLGTYPDVDKKPDIPYSYLGSDHLLFDLIYNPPKTTFLTEGERMGAKILNGREMLELQAERAWEIWNS